MIQCSTPSFPSPNNRCSAPRRSPPTQYYIPPFHHIHTHTHERHMDHYPHTQTHTDVLHTDDPAALPGRLGGGRQDVHGSAPPGSGGRLFVSIDMGGVCDSMFDTYSFGGGPWGCISIHTPPYKSNDRHPPPPPQFPSLLFSPHSIQATSAPASASAPRRC